jgi:hypothetical protein
MVAAFQFPLAAATLDGRSFAGVVLECGTTAGDADTLIFEGGRFRRQVGAGRAGGAMTRVAIVQQAPVFLDRAATPAVAVGSLDDAAAAGAMRDVAAALPDKAARLYAEPDEWINPGASCVVAPGGKIVAGPLNKSFGLLTADIDLARVGMAHRSLDVTGHRAWPDADAQSHPACSYKGGDPGVVRVTADNELAFPSYDGNGMFRSLGNVLANPAVGLLFIDFESPKRLRVNGQARIDDNDELLASFVGAQFVVRVRAERIFPNCPRYIQRIAKAEPSPYVPRAGHTPPVPKWKSFEMFADVLPRDVPATGR